MDAGKDSESEIVSRTQQSRESNPDVVPDVDAESTDGVRNEPKLTHSASPTPFIVSAVTPAGASSSRIDSDTNTNDNRSSDKTTPQIQQGVINSTESKKPFSKDDLCPICLTSFGDTEVATPDKCMHFFCTECLLTWTINKSTCPVDRIEFSNVLIRAGIEPKKHIVILTIPIESEEFAGFSESEIHSALDSFEYL